MRQRDLLYSYPIVYEDPCLDNFQLNGSSKGVDDSHENQLSFHQQVFYSSLVLVVI